MRITRIERISDYVICSSLLVVNSIEASLLVINCIEKQGKFRVLEIILDFLYFIKRLNNFKNMKTVM